MSLADVIVTAPVDPAFASLNIAQAVLLVGYEWYKGLADSLGQATPNSRPRGTRTTDERFEARYKN